MSATAPLPSVELVRERFGVLRDRIDQAGGAGRVEILAMTKGFGPELALTAHRAGLERLGENYAQELVTKVAAFAGEAATPEWHMVGAVQRNKVRLIAADVALWQTVDRTSLVRELAKRSPGARMLIQVNTTGEAQKNGCEPADVENLLADAVQAGLGVEGLMTVGPTDASVDPRASFRLLVRLADDLGLRVRSMGMSGDMETAVGEGSTMVRVGQALFGPRPTRPSMTD